MNGNIFQAMEAANKIPMPRRSLDTQAVKLESVVSKQEDDKVNIPNILKTKPKEIENGKIAVVPARKPDIEKGKAPMQIAQKAKKGTVESQMNFSVMKPWREIFTASQSQQNPQVGDISKLTEDYMKRAHSQKQTGKLKFDEIEKIQNTFVDPDIRMNEGRENNRNYKRGEYDFPARHDGQDAADRLAFVKNRQKEVNLGDILAKITDPDWTINTLNYAITTKPVDWTAGDRPKNWG